MVDINTLAARSHFVLGGIRVSEILADQSKLRGGRWTASNQYCVTDARLSAVDFDLPKNTAPATGAPMTDVPTTGAPPSVVRRT
jgi:hypothetical protein